MPYRVAGDGSRGSVPGYRALCGELQRQPRPADEEDSEDEEDNEDRQRHYGNLVAIFKTHTSPVFKPNILCSVILLGLMPESLHY